MDHKATIINDGNGMMAGKTPVCSCGWVGIRYEAHNDYQYTLVRNQIEQHIKLNAKEKTK